MRLTGLVLTGGLVAALAAAATPVATAQTPTVRFGITSSGTPDVSGATRLRVCPPGGECEITSGGRPELPAGTRVEALSATGAVLRTGTWGGTFQPTAPPTLTGAAVTRGQVTVTPGTWTGGWGDEVSRLAIRACRTPDAAPWACRVRYASATRAADAFFIDSDLAGYYLNAVQERAAKDDMRTVNGVLHWPRDPLSSVSAVVQISASPPAVELRRYATRSSRGYGVGTVRCWPTCEVKMTVRGARRKATHTLTARNRASLVFPRSAKLRPGLLRVKVTVDGVERANGIVRLTR